MNKALNKTLVYTGFAIAAIGVVFAFITAKSYTQLAIATVLYPAVAYFAIKILTGRSGKTPTITIQIPPRAVRQPEVVERRKVEVTDIDKRTFLKLIGAAGISFFLFSLLGRRVDSLLFNKTADTTGNGSGALPATAGYRISEIDEGGDVTYYGFTNADGGWLIMKEAADISSFRYAKGDLNFPKAWADRSNLKYDYYYNLN